VGIPYPIVPEPGEGLTGWEDPVPSTPKWTMVTADTGDEIYFDKSQVTAVLKGRDGRVIVYLRDMMIPINPKQYHRLITELIGDQ
jgi:hypothetical protein